jgi:hypothetical protein
MSEDIARLLYEGAVAVTEGRKTEAQRLLMRVVELDEKNEQGWLWLSGAVDDPADQQIALENVLDINPHNEAARAGLNLLRQRAATAPGAAATAAQPPQTLPHDDAAWSPPPPLDPSDALELICWQCGASLYSVAQFCWQCHAPVHCCNNCAYRYITRCKELQDLTSTMAQATQNKCPWWRPPSALEQ